MNRQIFFFLVFTFCCFVELQAQVPPTERAIPAAELINIRKGEVADFQKLMRRFESAIKENDLSSTNQLQSDVVLSIKKHISTFEAENVDDAAQQNRLKEQKEILKAVENFQFTGKQVNQEATLILLRQLHQFERLLDQNIITQ